MTKRHKQRDEAILKRLAQALAWDTIMVGAVPQKGATPRRIYDAQTLGCKERFDEMARELLPCLRKARLLVKLSEDR